MGINPPLQPHLQRRLVPLGFACIFALAFWGVRQFVFWLLWLSGHWEDVLQQLNSWWVWRYRGALEVALVQQRVRPHGTLDRCVRVVLVDRAAR
jgi:hypothetical protein